MKLRALLIPYLGILAAVLAGCGAFGTDDEGVGSDGDGENGDASAEEVQLESVLRPIFGFQQGQQLDVFVGRLPAAFPEDFPLPTGAEPSTGIDGASAGFLLVSFETDDSANELIDFYIDELEETSVSRGEQNIVRFDGPEGSTGQVIIDQFEEGSDANTLIVLFQGEPDVAEEEDETFELGESLELPEGFPVDRVPIYPDSTIVQTDSGAPQGFNQFGVTSITTDDFEPIIEFYEEELEAVGWEVADTVDDGASVQIQFSDADDPNSAGIVVITVFARDRTLTSVQIQLNAPLDDDEG